ncbi:unnamed protein product [Closterium sp. Naga37s-1]|nr:unnamed protein product [Closterium sp. Naga37s-1]
MRWCPVLAGSIRHLLQLGLGRLGMVLGFPGACLPGLSPPPQLHRPPLFELRRGVLPSGSHSPVRLPFQSLLLVRTLVRPAMPVSIGDEYYSYSPRPFVVASAASAPPASLAVSSRLLPRPFTPRRKLSAPGVAPGHAPASPPAPALAPASAPAPAPGPVVASDPGHASAPAPVVPPVPVVVPAPVPVVAASSAAVGEASAPPPVAPAVAPSAAAGADPTYQPPPATSVGLSSAEVQSARVSPPDAPAPLPAAVTVSPPNAPRFVAGPGTPVDVVGATVSVVRQLWLNTSGMLAAVEADRM